MVLSNWGGNAVLDHETGLVWERDPQAARGPSGAKQNYGNAVALCVPARTGGRKGWRLPAINELQSLYDPSAAASGWMLPVGPLFINILTGFFADDGSSTRFPTEPTSAFAQGFSPRGSVVTDGIDAVLGVWCVRGPGISF